jgi:lysophospholipase L1-like esterase
VTAEQTFASLLRQDLAAGGRSMEFINAALGGENSDQAMARFEQDVIAHRPALVTIMYGANDQVVETGKAEPRVSLKRYERNLREMVERLRAAGAKPVLMTPIPLGKHWDYGANPPYNDRGNNCLLVDYAHAVRAVALDLDVPLVDNFGAWAEASLLGTDIDTLMVDGCHPNTEGHGLIAATMLPVLAKALQAR